MANKKNAIVLNVDLNAAGALKGIKKLGGAVGGLGVGALAGAAGILALGTAMAVATAKASGHAAKLELVQNKSKIVFGEQLPMIQHWSSTLASAFGLTEVNLIGMSASFADLLIPLGFARTEAANMTTKVVGLAGALSEWSGGNRTVEDTTRILARAMLGEREMLKDLGVDIRELDITQRLASKGLEGLTGNILKQAKAVATMEMLFERTVDARKAYAAGSDSLYRKTNQLKASFSELVQELQIQLTPSFASLVDVLINEVMPVIEDDLFPVIKDLIDKFVESLPGAIAKFTDVLQNDLAPNIKKAGEHIDDLGTAMKNTTKFAKDFRIVLGFLSVAIGILLRNAFGPFSVVFLVVGGAMAVFNKDISDVIEWIKTLAGWMEKGKEKTEAFIDKMQFVKQSGNFDDRGKDPLKALFEDLANMEEIAEMQKKNYDDSLLYGSNQSEDSSGWHEIRMRQIENQGSNAMDWEEMLHDQQMDDIEKLSKEAKKFQIWDAWQYDQQEESLKIINTAGEIRIGQMKEQTDWAKKLSATVSATAVATALISDNYLDQTPAEQAIRLRDAKVDLLEAMKTQDSVKKLAKIIEIMVGISSPEKQQQQLYAADTGPDASAKFRKDADIWSKNLLMRLNSKLNWGGAMKSDQDMINLFSNAFKRDQKFGEHGEAVDPGNASRNNIDGFVKHMLNTNFAEMSKDTSREAQMRRIGKTINSQAKDSEGAWKNDNMVGPIIIQAPITDPQAIAVTLVEVLTQAGYVIATE